MNNRTIEQSTSKPSFHSRCVNMTRLHSHSVTSSSCSLGLGRGSKGSRSFFSKRSQTSTEYLIILAVVVVIALIVVGILGGIPSIGGGASGNAKRTAMQSEAIGVSNFAVLESGSILLLKNNQPNAVEINAVWFDKLPCVLNNSRFPIRLSVGQEVRIECGNIVAKVVRDRVPDVNVIWTDVRTSASYTTYERRDKMKSQECFWADNLTDCMEFYVKDGCGTGTVLHTLSGLCWQADLSHSNTLNWTNAILYCDNLVLCSGGIWDGNHTTPGTCSGSVLHDDWYLPSLNEWSTVRDLGQTSAPYIVGGTSLFENYPGSGTRNYWTSSGGSWFAWIVNLGFGNNFWGSQAITNRAVCSRWNN